jgi:hypothetical protein
MAVRVNVTKLEKKDLDEIFNSRGCDSAVTRLWKPKGGEVYIFRSNSKGV